MLTAGRRDPAVTVMHAHGLTLEEVGYPPEEDLAARAREARAVRTLAAPVNRPVSEPPSPPSSQ